MSLRLTSPRSGAARAFAALALALTVTTCRDALGPRTATRARIAVTPVLPAEATLAAFGLTIDAVRFVVVRPAADTLADTTLALHPDSNQLALDLHVVVVAAPETLNVSIVALSGTIPLFTGTRPVPVPTPLPPPEIPLDTYIGPVADSIVIVPRSPFIPVNDSLRFQVQGFDSSGAPVTQFYVAWSTSDSGLAPINHFGVLTAPATRGAVRVRARTPSGAADSITATFTLPATQLVALAGGGQSDTVGHPLGVPLEVEARAADGLGVGGVTVRFRALSGGGTVADSLVVTDSAGRARTSATLGGGLGLQTFEATATGLAGSPVTFNATALTGPPTQLLATAGDAQVVTVATPVATRPAVVLKDAGGNPVAGAAVTFTAASGGGGVTGGSQITDAAGAATVGSWTLGTLAGTNTLTASAAGLSRTFTATAIAGAPAQLVVSAGDFQSAAVGAAVAVRPAVRVEDQYGNPVAGAAVTFAVSGGGGSVTGATQLSTAAGVATVGSWTLGTAVGANGLTASSGSATPVSFTATALAGAATTIVKVAGDLQSGVVNNLVATTPRVRLLDQFGNPVVAAGVAFAVTAGGGAIVGASQTTDTAGFATLGSWRLGTGIGPNALSATAGALSATFAATALAGPAKNIVAFAGNGQSALVNSVLPINPIVVVRDTFNNPVAGVAMTFAPAGGGSVTGASDTTDAGGAAQVGSWTLASVAGANTLTASGGGLSVDFTATGVAGAATQLAKLSGDGLSAVVGQSVGTMPSVKALDQFGNPVAGVTVTFTLAGGGALVGAAPVTNGAGIATLGGWTLDTLAGPNGVLASASGGVTVSFSASGLADVAVLLQKLAGDGQTAVVNTALPTVPLVRLVDRYGNPVEGDSVLFDILIDGGALGDSLVATDALGQTTPTSWTIADFVDTNILQASAAGVSPVQFSAVGIPDVPAQLLRASIDTQTALVGEAVSVPPAVEVRDQYFNPVPGVAVDFAVTAGGGTASPLSTITDAAGVARVTTWILGGVVGLNTLDATSSGLAGSPITFSANGITTAATSIALDAGDGQSGVVATALPVAYAVRVLDISGAPVQSVLVHWAEDGTGGAMSPTTSVTDVNGIATSTRILGQVAGPQTATATVGGLSGSPVVFNATALAGAPVALVKRSADPQTGIVATALAAPIVEVVDPYNNPVAGIAVTFTPGDLPSVLGATAGTTDAAGRATTGTWTLGTLIGTSTVTASAPGVSDVLFTATGIAGAASNVVMVDGDGQSGTAGQPLPLPYRVRVVDGFGNRVRAITVNWEIDARAGGGIAPTSVPTDTGGIAAAIHTLGNTAGPHSAFAWVTGLPDTVTFTSIAAAGAAAQIFKQAGDTQTAVVNTAVGAPITVLVTDAAGAPVAGHSVTWTVTSGGGSLGGPTTVLTDTAGIATAPLWTLGTGAGSNGLSGSAPGLAGNPVAFTATGQAGPATQIAINDGDGQSATVATAVAVNPSVVLKDQFNNLVPGAVVTFAPLLGGGTVTGGTSTTDAQGIALVGSWTLGTLAGPNTLRASAAGVQPRTFTATGLADAPVRLAFVTEPSPSLAGDTILPPVRVAFQDQFGNTNPLVPDLVSLQLGNSPAQGAKLVGTLSALPVSGVAVFADLAIDSAGSGFTIVASTLKLPSSESKPFDVGGVIRAVIGDRLDPVDAAFDRGTGLVFVPGKNNTLGVLDPGKGQLTQFSYLQGEPFAVAVNSATGRAYVTTHAGKVVVIDTRDPVTPLVFMDVLYPAKGVAVDEATDRVFVAVDGDAGKGIPPALVIIDGNLRETVGTIPFRDGAVAGLGVAFNPADRLVYVAIPNLGVGVFDPSKSEHVTTVPIVGEKGAAGTYDVGVDERANRVYATNRADSSFSVIDPAGLKELDRVRVGDLPEGLGVDSNSGVVYVANSGGNTLSFIAPDPKGGRFTVFATLIVGPTPKAAAADPGTGRVYVPTFGDSQVRVVQP